MAYDGLVFYDNSGLSDSEQQKLTNLVARKPRSSESRQTLVDAWKSSQSEDDQKNIEKYDLGEFAHWVGSKRVHYYNFVSHLEKQASKVNIIHVYFCELRMVEDPEVQLNPPWIQNARKDHMLSTATVIVGNTNELDGFYGKQMSKVLPSFSPVVLHEDAQPLWQVLVKEIKKILESEEKMIVFTNDAGHNDAWFLYFLKEVAMDNFVVMLHRRDKRIILTHQVRRGLELAQLAGASEYDQKILLEQGYLKQEKCPIEEHARDQLGTWPEIVSPVVEARDQAIGARDREIDNVDRFVDGEIARLKIDTTQIAQYQKDWEQWFSTQVPNSKNKFEEWFKVFNGEKPPEKLSCCVYSLYKVWIDKYGDEYNRLIRTLKRLDPNTFEILHLRYNDTSFSEKWIETMQKNYNERVLTISLYDDECPLRPEKSYTCFHCPLFASPTWNRIIDRTFPKVYGITNRVGEFIHRQYLSGTPIILVTSKMNDTMMQLCEDSTILVYQDTKEKKTLVYHKSLQASNSSALYDYLTDDSRNHWNNLKKYQDGVPSPQLSIVDLEQLKSQIPALLGYKSTQQVKSFSYPTDLIYGYYFPNIQYCSRYLSVRRVAKLDPNRSFLSDQKDTDEYNFYLRCRGYLETQQKGEQFFACIRKLKAIDVSQYDIISIEGYYYPESFREKQIEPSWIKYATETMKLKVLRIISCNQSLFYMENKAIMFDFCIPDIFTKSSNNIFTAPDLLRQIIQNWVNTSKKNVVFTWKPEYKDSMMLWYLKEHTQNSKLTVCDYRWHGISLTSAYVTNMKLDYEKHLAENNTMFSGRDASVWKSYSWDFPELYFKICFEKDAFPEPPLQTQGLDFEDSSDESASDGSRPASEQGGSDHGSEYGDVGNGIPSDSDSQTREDLNNMLQENPLSEEELLSLQDISQWPSYTPEYIIEDAFEIPSHFECTPSADFQANEVRLQDIRNILGTAALEERKQPKLVIRLKKNCGCEEC